MRDRATASWHAGATGPTVAEGDGAKHRQFARGTPIGRFLALRELGAGGMGVVYEAYDPELERKVAIKVVRPPAASSLEHYRERLLREARAIARLSHPNVITVYDAGELDDGLFVAMELIRGVTLRAWLTEQRSWQEILAKFIDAGRGLAAGHTAGLVHRDFKPENVLVGDDGRVLVIDFGLAAAVHGPPPSESQPSEGKSSLDLRITQPGVVVGTPRYMAPEQHTDGAIDARTDQFAFCVALYHALYGSWPFDGTTPEELYAAIIAGPRPIERDRAPRWLGELVLRGLAADPAKRHASMDFLLGELARDRGAGKRRLAIAATAAAMIATTAAVALLVGSRDNADAVCARADDRGREMWSAPTRAGVIAALGPAGTAAAAQLDRWMGSWSAARVDVCKATRERGTQSEAVLDLRMRCLDRRLAEAHALVELFVASGKRPVDKPVEAVLRLDPVTTCDDLDSLRASAPLPSDPMKRAQISAAREQVVKGQALHLTGRYDEALALVRRVAASTAPLDFAPLAADLSHRMGALEDALGHYDAATKHLTDAFEQAARAHHDTLAAHAAILRLTTLANASGKFDAALAHVGWARAAVARAGDHPSLRRDLENAVGILELGAGRPAAARRHFEAAIAFGAGIEDLDTLDAYANLGSTLDELGLHGEALPWKEKAVKSARALFGPSHPQTATALNNLGSTLIALGRERDGVAALEQARAIFEAALGPKHPNVASVLQNLANLADDVHVEIEMRRRVLAMLVELHGTDHPRVAEATVLLGTALSYAGPAAEDEAVSHLERAGDIYRRTAGDDHPDLVLVYAELGTILNRRRDHAAALTACRRANALDRARLEGRPHVQMVHGLTCEAVALLGLGKPREALAVTDGAMPLLDPGTPGHGDFTDATAANLRWARARAMYGVDPRAKGIRELVETARVVWEEDSEMYAVELAEAKAFLARLGSR